MIAFFGTNAGGFPSILTVDPDGTDVTDVLGTDSWDDLNLFDFTWNADGTRLVMLADNLCVYSLDPANGALEPLPCIITPPPLEDRFEPETIALSPDGSRIAFGNAGYIGDGETDIWTLDLETGVQSVLFDENRDCVPPGHPNYPSLQGTGYPAWSSLGLIAVGRVDDGDWCAPNEVRGVWTLEADGSNLTPVALLPYPYTWPSNLDWSPDGSKIAFESMANVYVLAAAGGTPSLVVSNAYRPAWSPDGTKIVFASSGLLYTADADGSNVQSLGVAGGNPSWQPLVAPPDPDADADGVDDAIDTGAGSFDDGEGTSGSIVDAAGLTVYVADDAEGVRVTVSGPGTEKASVMICGFSIKIAGGSEVVIGCASVIVQVITGSAKVELGGGAVVVTVPEGGQAEVSELGDTFYAVDNLGPVPVTVTVDGEPSTVPVGGSTEVSDDVTDPMVTCNPASFLLNEPAALVTATVSDSESGPVTSAVGGPAATASPGSHTVQLTASDEAGNSTTASCGYDVR